MKSCRSFLISQFLSLGISGIEMIVSGIAQLGGGGAGREWGWYEPVETLSN